MLSTQQLNEIIAFKPRTYRRATMEQRKQIAAEFERTGDKNKAFASVRFSKLTDSDLSFEGIGTARVGGAR